jgi:F0F1-type ATP synthase membrane subunit b/b'
VENARRRTETIIEKAQQQAQQVRTDVTSEAQRVLESRVARSPSRSAGRWSRSGRRW